MVKFLKFGLYFGWIQKMKMDPKAVDPRCQKPPKVKYSPFRSAIENIFGRRNGSKKKK